MICNKIIMDNVTLFWGNLVNTRKKSKINVLGHLQTTLLAATIGPFAKKVFGLRNADIYILHKVSGFLR